MEASKCLIQTIKKCAQCVRFGTIKLKNWPTHSGPYSERDPDKIHSFKNWRNKKFGQLKAQSRKICVYVDCQADVLCVCKESRLKEIFALANLIPPA